MSTNIFSIFMQSIFISVCKISSSHSTYVGYFILWFSIGIQELINKTKIKLTRVM